MSSEEFNYKVTVKTTSGTEEFYADSSFDNTADGRILYWSGVMKDGRRMEIYSIPVHTIINIEEQDLTS